MRSHGSIFFVSLFYSVLVISVLASDRLDAASFQLSWIDNSDNEDGFHIERKIGNNGIFSIVATASPNVTSYTDDNLASNTTYCYRLNAFNDIGISAYTNEACGTTPAATPTSPPTFDFSLTNGGNKSLTQGQSATNTITATLTAGSPQGVSFSTSGLPAGATASYTTSASCNPTCSRTLNIATATSTSAGTSTITVTGTGGGVTKTTTFTLTVNATTTNPPSPPSGNNISMNIANGAVLSGSSVVWTATASGSPVRVEFFIDGTLLWTEHGSPYQFNGSGSPSGTLNTNTLSNGSHQLRVRAVYSNSSTAEQAVTVTISNGSAPSLPPPVSSTIVATLLGQTGEDIAGTTSETPDGIQDVHIRLSGVQGTIVRAIITDGGDGVWETPYNGWWIVAIRPRSDPSLVDLYFDFWQPTSTYTLTLTFADGTTQTVQTSAAAPTAPPPVSSTIAATLLGQTGEDIAGTTSETPDGIPDVHIRLSGVQGTITQVRITDGGNGVWETPYTDSWIVAIRPHSDPSLVDLYFDFWQPTSAYTLNITLANGTTQTVLTSASLSLQMLGNSP